MDMRKLVNPTVITLYELAQALGVEHLELVKPDAEGGADGFSQSR
jgi:transcriptional regulator with XRE-family HTH domain